MNKFSVIIPCYNESKNIFKLVKELKDNLSQEIYEIVIIDDKSNDESFEVYKRLEMNNIKIYYNEKNMGQSFSLYKGIQLAKYDTIITIDGDGQNDPKDLNKIINKYLNTINIKLISGVRKNRKDSFSKIIASNFDILRTIVHEKIFLNRFRWSKYLYITILTYHRPK